MDSTLQSDCIDLETDVMAKVLLPGLPIDLIRACYAAAPGNEIASGECLRTFLLRPAHLPPLPRAEA